MGEARLPAVLLALAAGLASSALGGLDMIALIEAGVVIVLALTLPRSRAGASAGVWMEIACLSPGLPNGPLALQIIAPTTAC